MFKLIMATALGANSLTAISAPQKNVVKFAESFDALKNGDELPISWKTGFYGATGSPVWKISADKDAPSPPHVLKQSGQASYSWLIVPNFVLQSGFVEVGFQIAAGKEDPEAGIIWRFIDGKNYSYVRANSLENNIVVYKMQDGKKIQLKSASIAIGKTWHKLRSDFIADGISIKLDGKEVLSLSNRGSDKTGSVGLYTTADTVAHFDNLSAEGN